MQIKRVKSITPKSEYSKKFYSQMEKTHFTIVRTVFLFTMENKQ